MLNKLKLNSLKFISTVPWPSKIKVILLGTTWSLCCILNLKQYTGTKAFELTSSVVVSPTPETSALFSQICQDRKHRWETTGWPTKTSSKGRLIHDIWKNNTAAINYKISNVKTEYLTSPSVLFREVNCKVTIINQLTSSYDNWITRRQKEMGNCITLTQVNYVRKADETSSVAIRSQTPCFDPKWPWLFHQIRWKHYDIAPESASSSPSPIIHASSFCTWKPTEGSFTLRLTRWERRRKVWRTLQSFKAFPLALMLSVLPVIMNSRWTLELSRSVMRVDADNRARAITSCTSGAQTPQLWPRDNWVGSVRGRDGITPPNWTSPLH